MRLLIATRNRHKVQEIRSILGDQFEYSSLADFPDAPEVHEDADTFEGNARKKAVEISQWFVGAHGRDPQSVEVDHTGAPPCAPMVLADDSGLEVDALGGAPGVFSARYAGKQGDHAANNRKLLDVMKKVLLEKRTARFRCIIAVAQPDGRIAIADGTCEGRIGFELRGMNGFGYDPLFVPDGYKQTFAELGADVKDKISHRARALEKAKQILVGANGGAPESGTNSNRSGRTAVRPYDPSVHHRRTIRRYGFDYSQTGIYFVTICSEGRKRFFGQVMDGTMRLSEFGRIVEEEWRKSPEIRKEITLHEWVVMPNHMHGLVKFVGAHGGAPQPDENRSQPIGAHSRGAHSRGAHSRVPLRRPRSLASFIAGFKAATTKRINEIRGSQGAPVWQRNYFEHIVRDDQDLSRIRQYILTNPQRWELDRENPDRKGVDEFDEWMDSL